jgi:hypothetical protein
METQYTNLPYIKTMLTDIISQCIAFDDAVRHGQYDLMETLHQQIVNKIMSYSANHSANHSTNQSINDQLHSIIQLNSKLMERVGLNKTFKKHSKINQNKNSIVLFYNNDTNKHDSFTTQWNNLWYRYNDMINFVTMNCNDQKNMKHCNDLNIVEHPTIKIFTKTNLLDFSNRLQSNRLQSNTLQSNTMNEQNLSKFIDQNIL